MEDYKYLSKLISDQLENGHQVVLVSIINMEGSTPRESGSKMVIGYDGKPYGTVGGSLLEAKAISEARNCLVSQRPLLLDFDLTGQSTSADGMICGGKARLLLDYIPPSVSNAAVFHQVYANIVEGKHFYFLTCFNQINGNIRVDGHALFMSDGTVHGDSKLGGDDISTVKDELHNISSTAVLDLGTRSLVIDPVSRVKTLYCFGAGHVAVPTAHIAAMVGFRVVVLDDRDEFANSQRFPDASSVMVIDDFSLALDKIVIDEDSFIVIVTRGHKYDRIVLEQVIRTKAGYIGMISSRSKRNAIYNTLIDEGIATASELEKVHSPIGLPIGGQNPEEIAVSIVAELISVREKQKK